MKPRTVWGCQSRARMISVTHGTGGALEQPDDVRILGASSYSHFVRSDAVLRRVCFSLKSCRLRLERIPGCGYSGLAVGEPLHRCNMADCSRAATRRVGRPRFRQVVKLVEDSEVIA